MLKLTGWKTILIFTLKKEQKLLIDLKKCFSNWWSILFMAKQWKTWKKGSVLKEGTMRKIIWNMLANQPLFHQKKNDKNFAAIHEKKKTVLTLTKPIYVEFAVLELSKWLIYDFHYNFYVSK